MEFPLIRSQALRHTLRDAAAGIKRSETQQPVSTVSFSGNTFLTRFAHLDQSKAPFRAGPSKQTTSKSAVPASSQRYHGPAFANPEILGDPPEADFRNEDGENMKVDPRFTGRCDTMLENSACDPEVIKEMEFEEQAIWLGKWFAHHYAAWVSKFDMKELETSENNDEWKRDLVVGPVEALRWTFRRFLIPEDEWRNPMLCSPVWCSPLSAEFPSRFSSFGKASGAFVTKLYQPSARTPSVYSASRISQRSTTVTPVRKFRRYVRIISFSTHKAMVARWNDISGAIASLRGVSFLFHLANSELFHRHFASFCSVRLRSTLVVTRSQQMSVL